MNENTVELSNNKIIISFPEQNSCFYKVSRNISEQELSAIIGKMLLALKLAPHIVGYYYLKSCIIKNTLRESKLPIPIGELYVNIAKEYATTPKKVERGINKAISSINDKCDRDYIFNIILGYEIDSSNFELKTKELVAIISDQLRIHYGII